MGNSSRREKGLVDGKTFRFENLDIFPQFLTSYGHELKITDLKNIFFLF